MRLWLIVLPLAIVAIAAIGVGAILSIEDFACKWIAVGIAVLIAGGALLFTSKFTWTKKIFLPLGLAAMLVGVLLAQSPV